MTGIEPLPYITETDSKSLKLQISFKSKPKTLMSFLKFTIHLVFYFGVDYVQTMKMNICLKENVRSQTYS